jgi:hypothetical protein
MNTSVRRKQAGEGKPRPTSPLPEQTLWRNISNRAFAPVWQLYAPRIGHHGHPLAVSDYIMMCPWQRQMVPVLRALVDFRRRDGECPSAGYGGLAETVFKQLLSAGRVQGSLRAFRSFWRDAVR